MENAGIPVFGPVLATAPTNTTTATTATTATASTTATTSSHNRLIRYDRIDLAKWLARSMCSTATCFPSTTSLFFDSPTLPSSSTNLLDALQHQSNTFPLSQEQEQEQRQEVEWAYYDQNEQAWFARNPRTNQLRSLFSPTTPSHPSSSPLSGYKPEALVQKDFMLIFKSVLELLPPSTRPFSATLSDTSNHAPVHFTDHPRNKHRPDWVLHPLGLDPIRWSSLLLVGECKANNNKGSLKRKRKRMHSGPGSSSSISIPGANSSSGSSQKSSSHHYSMGHAAQIADYLGHWWASRPAMTISYAILNKGKQIWLFKRDPDGITCWPRPTTTTTTTTTTNDSSQLLSSLGDGLDLDQDPKSAVELMYTLATITLHQDYSYSDRLMATKLNVGDSFWIQDSITKSMVQVLVTAHDLVEEDQSSLPPPFFFNKAYNYTGRLTATARIVIKITDTHTGTDTVYKDSACSSQEPLHKQTNDVPVVARISQLQSDRCNKGGQVYALIRKHIMMAATSTSTSTSASTSTTPGPTDQSAASSLLPHCKAVAQTWSQTILHGTIHHEVNPDTMPALARYLSTCSTEEDSVWIPELNLRAQRLLGDHRWFARSESFASTPRSPTITISEAQPRGLPINKALDWQLPRIAAETIAALHAFRSIGLLHCDISEGNVLCKQINSELWVQTIQSPSPQLGAAGPTLVLPHIIDWDDAKLVDSPVDGTAKMLMDPSGTKLFWSPKIHSNEKRLAQIKSLRSYYELAPNPDILALIQSEEARLRKRCLLDDVYSVLILVMLASMHKFRRKLEDQGPSLKSWPWDEWRTNHGQADAANFANEQSIIPGLLDTKSVIYLIRFKDCFEQCFVRLKQAVDATDHLNVASGAVQEHLKTNDESALGASAQASLQQIIDDLCELSRYGFKLLSK